MAPDGGAAIVAGNERVVRARLSDAKFFWESDLKVRLEDRLPKLDSIVFHEKLGTQGERVQRIAALARELAPLVGADPDKAERAARLAKADLVSEMVGEFPELQGLMGRYYAAAQGEDASVAAAVEEHYKPQGPSDRVPSDPVSIAVALADKLDTLVGFWAIDEKPTGSKDPYALRRAALGVIRIVLENEVAVELHQLNRCRHYVVGTLDALQDAGASDACSDRRVTRESASQLGYPTLDMMAEGNVESQLACRQRRRRSRRNDTAKSSARLDLLAFFADRLKVYLRDQGARHDLIDAVFALPGQDDLLMIVRRVEALGPLPRHGGRQIAARRLSPRRQHPARRGEEGRGRGLRRRLRSRAARSQPEEQALAETLGSRRERGRGGRRARGFRGRHAGHGAPAPAGRCLLRQGHGQCRRPGAAPQPPAPAQRAAPDHADRRGFLEGGGVAPSRPSC